MKPDVAAPQMQKPREFAVKSIVVSLDFPKKIAAAPARNNANTEISHVEVFMRTGLSRSLLLNMAAQNLFPLPVRQSSFAHFWRLTDVDRWCSMRCK